MPGNSPLFKRRLNRLKKSRGRSTPRVPRKYKGEKPEHHSDLFTDENPKGTVHGLKIKNETKAKESVKQIKLLLKNKKITYAHGSQIVNTLIQRAKYHAHQTPDIKKGGKVWLDFKNKELSKYK